jgi:hypothetical protein
MSTPSNSNTSKKEDNNNLFTNIIVGGVAIIVIVGTIYWVYITYNPPKKYGGFSEYPPSGGFYIYYPYL